MTDKEFEFALKGFAIGISIGVMAAVIIYKIF